MIGAFQETHEPVNVAYVGMRCCLRKVENPTWKAGLGPLQKYSCLLIHTHTHAHQYMYTRELVLVHTHAHLYI